MAGTKKDKTQQSPAAPKGTSTRKGAGSFADDLDSMLDLNGSPDQQVGLIDDDEAIDRLLVGDVFEEQDENSRDGSDDIDRLLAINDSVDEMREIDEFAEDVDDLVLQTPISTEPESVQVPPLETIGIDDEVDSGELEMVGEIDELTGDEPLMPDLKTEQPPMNDKLDNMAEIDDMTEIDEFSDESEPVGDNSDFLVADFDISAEDATPVKRSGIVADDVQTVAEEPASETFDDQTFDDQATEEYSTLEAAELSDSLAMDEDLAEPAEAPDTGGNNVLIAEHAAALAGLGAQIQSLIKQNTQLSRDIQLKSNREELTACLETLDTLQTEQKKTKRNLDAVGAKKPVSAYVANGIAVLALLVGGGLGIQGYIAKSQVNQLVEVINNLQTQITTGPATDAAEKAQLQNQLDELTRVGNVNAEQIAELGKALHGEGAVKPADDLSKQLAELSRQDMQMGAAIESLQTKIAAIQKGGKAPVVAKPEPKKPEVAKENWLVNLVAFKQDWYAKRKAEEFAAKGVNAKVIKAETKGENWYRLSVDGFNSQYEAAAYAARVKKTLNLDSVWVSKNK